MNNLQDRDIRLNDTHLKDLRSAMDSIVKLLDYNLPEERKIELTNIAQGLWHEILEMKKL